MCVTQNHHLAFGLPSIPGEYISKLSYCKTNPSAKKKTHKPYWLTLPVVSKFLSKISLFAKLPFYNAKTF